MDLVGFVRRNLFLLFFILAALVLQFSGAYLFMKRTYQLAAEKSSQDAKEIFFKASQGLLPINPNNISDDTLRKDKVFLLKILSDSSDLSYLALIGPERVLTETKTNYCKGIVFQRDLKDLPVKVSCIRSKFNTKYLAFFYPLWDNVQLVSVYKIRLYYHQPLIFILLSFILLLSFTAYCVIKYQKDFQHSITEINKVVESISNKDFDVKIHDEYPGQLGLLVNAINRMSEQLKEVYENLELRVIRRTSEISMRNAELRKKQREILKQNQELKSAYEALKETREKYEKLILHLEEEYIFYSQSINGDLLFVSPSVKNILGYDVNEFRKLYNYIYTDNPINDKAKKMSEESRKGSPQPKYIKEIYDQQKMPKVLEISEVPIFNEDGQLVSVEGLAHDITERQHAEELIKEQEEKYRMLFTNASDFIILYEVDVKNNQAGHILEVNNYTIEKLGFTLEEFREKTPLQLRAEDIWIDEEADDEMFIAEHSKFERIWETKSQELLDVEISSHTFNIRDRKVAIVVARDITDRKQAEKEIRFINEELYNQKENLEALVDNLTQTQEQLVQSEKMAALGQLIAGIAHEINTPLGAIKASIGNLSDSLEIALGELPKIFQASWQKNLKLFRVLFEEARKKSLELSSREKRAVKREISSELKSKQIADAEIIADILVYLDIYEPSEQLKDYLKMTNALDVIKTTRNFISLQKNTSTINLAVEKATKVVFALKKYAHRDAGGEKVPTDITDSIETVLTLYHNQLKQGIEVVRNYDNLPLIECYQDEISQVWTNLIQNAIQAMKQEGTLTITTKLHGDTVILSFKDNGPGIDPDIKDRIFEPFFTTKKQGEGSGLGLDIVKKIVDKHNGSVWVETKLDEGADFIIKLPVN